MQKLPAWLQSTFWSSDINKLDINKHKSYIIHQILSWGSFREWKWLLANYPIKTIRKVFIEKPHKDYRPEVYHFVKNYVLGLKQYQLDKDNYVTSILGPVRQRAIERLAQT